MTIELLKLTPAYNLLENDRLVNMFQIHLLFCFSMMFFFIVVGYNGI